MGFLNDWLLKLADAPSTPPLGLSQALGNSVCPVLPLLGDSLPFSAMEVARAT